MNLKFMFLFYTFYPFLFGIRGLKEVENWTMILLGFITIPQL